MHTYIVLSTCPERESPKHSLGAALKDFQKQEVGAKTDL